MVKKKLKKSLQMIRQALSVVLSAALIANTTTIPVSAEDFQSLEYVTEEPAGIDDEWGSVDPEMQTEGDSQELPEKPEYVTEGENPPETEETEYVEPEIPEEGIPEEVPGASQAEETVYEDPSVTAPDQTPYEETADDDGIYGLRGGFIRAFRFRD